MDIQVNEKFVKSNDMIGGNLIITPPLDEDYWVLRVPVSKKQAIVAFPKFFTIGIGFQHEEDWNTNLPYSCDAEEIYNHIKHNAGSKKITKQACVEAIVAIQEEIKRLDLSNKIHGSRGV